MAVYTERVQTLLTSEQLDELRRLADEREKSVSLLIREAVEQAYFVEMTRRRRTQALERLLALEAPVGEWAEMEAEIERGAAGA